MLSLKKQGDTQMDTQQGRDINHKSEEAKEMRKTEELTGEAVTIEENQDRAEKNREARKKTHI